MARVPALPHDRRRRWLTRSSTITFTAKSANLKPIYARGKGEVQIVQLRKFRIAEAKWIAKKVKELLDKRAWKPHEIIVLVQRKRAARRHPHRAQSPRRRRQSRTMRRASLRRTMRRCASPVFKLLLE